MPVPRGLLRDVGYALRVLRRAPGFTAAVVVSLGLGIGANTAIFTLLDAVLWRLLPVHDPRNLLVLGRQRPGESLQTGFTHAQFRLLRDDASVADVAGYATAPIQVSVDGSPEPSIQGQLVSGGYFTLLGVRAAIGRAIGPDDDRVPNGHPVAMLGHGYWERRFARDPRVIGRTIRLSAAPFTIIGVTPPEFSGVEAGVAPDIFVPLTMQPTVMPAFENLLENPMVMRTWVQALARTRPGVDRPTAAAVLDAVLQSQGTEPRPASTGPPPPRVVLAPATAVSDLRRQFSKPLFVLLAMVGIVLLTACANTANLLLARAAARRPELGLRLALGAGRARLVRQLLVESVVLAVLGGVCGVLLARWATQLLVVFMSSGRTPIALDLTPNPRVLLFTAAVSILTGLLFGLAPAWRATRIDLAPALRQVQPLSRGLRPGRILAVVQLALSMLLLAGAGLFVRSLQNLSGVSGDVPRDRVLILRVEPRGSDQRGVPGASERLDRTYRELIRRARALPGVQLASMANGAPTAPTSSAGMVVTTPSGVRTRLPIVMVYPEYFATVGLPLVSGRDFGAADLAETAPAVCIVNESFARLMFPGQDPIGRPCTTGRRSRLLSAPAGQPMAPEAFQIVGVVKDSRYSNPRGEVQPVVYQTFLQTNTGRGQMMLHVRVAGNVGDVVRRIREEVTVVDAAMPMFDVHTLEEEMHAALMHQRLVALLSTLFSGLALLLAGVGLYGLLAFTLVQRTNEIGIRMALGAQRSDVVRLVVREALLLVAIGIAIGIPAAFAAARLLSSRLSGLLFGLTATDPGTLAAAALVLASVAAVAAYLPARRATRIDPLTALRY